jgi:hypothetical protein
MIRHVNSVHRQSTLYMCLICMRKFRRRDKARDHILNVHKIPRNSDSVYLRSLTLIEESMKGGGDVIPGDTMIMKGGVESFCVPGSDA